MKKILLIAFALTTFGAINAQKIELTSAIVELTKKKNVEKAFKFINDAETKLNNGGSLKDSDKDKFHYYKGLIYQRMGGIDSTLEGATDIAYNNLKLAVESGGKYVAKAKAGLNGIYGQVVESAYNQYEAKEFDASIESFERSFEIRELLGASKDTNNMYYVAYVALEGGKQDVALEYTNALLEMTPSDPKYHNLKLSLYKAVGEDGSVEYLEGYTDVLNAARGAASDDQTILFEEINYYIAQDDVERLNAALDPAIEKDPENGNLYYVKGFALENMGKLDEALSYYKTAVEKDDTHADAFYNIGKYYLDQANNIALEMNNLGFSAAEKKKYDSLDVQLASKKKEALPFLEKSFVLKNDADLEQILSRVYYELDMENKVPSMKASAE